jgi:hypothetical protein
MLRSLVTLALVCSSAVGVVMTLSRSSELPLTMAAASMDAIRAGTNCSYPLEQPDPCTVCQDLGGGLYGKCDKTSSNSSCPYAGGPCFTCTLAVATCPGNFFKYNLEGCPDGNGMLFAPCTREYAQPTEGGCIGYCS